jgi:hypothetical protein
MAIFILIWILYCLIEGFDHAWYEKINHTRATFRRCALGALVIYALCGVSSHWAMYVNAALTLASIFTVCFDVAFNLSRGKEWNYIGNTAYLDRIFRKKPLLWWVVKFVLAALCITVQLITAKYFVEVSTLINISWPS